MSGFTIKNLKELEDSATGRAEGIEARFGRSKLDFEHLGVSLFRFGPGVRAPFGHSHGEQEEAYIVLSGTGRIKLGDEIHELREWDVVRVAPDVIRAIEGGADGIEFLAIGSDRPEGGDGVIAKDWWVD